MSAPLNLTPQQAAILTADGFSVGVSAGAGCGKTFVLTQRFLAFLRPRAWAERRADPLAKIVAITFTEKAAREMRHRVRKACAEELRGCPPADVEHWLGVLRGIDSARISTIHAYCTQLLRAYAVEAALDPGFGVAESAFGDTLLRRAAQEAVCTRLEAADPDAEEFVLRFGYETTVERVAGLLSGSRYADADRFDNYTPETLAAEWLTFWRTHGLARSTERFLTDEAFAAVARLLEQGPPDAPKLAARYAALVAAFAHPPDADGLPTWLDTLVENATLAAVGKAKWIDEDTHEAAKTQFGRLRDAAKDLRAMCELMAGDATEAARWSLAAHRLVKAAADIYETLKRQRGRLDFDDLLLLARDLLRNDPRVRRRASAGIDLLMVDEVQDTDPVQAEIVRLLCGERLPGGMLFLVGDAKQSIYRFRKADPRVFAAMRAELPAAGRLPLSANFRSQPAILRFVNFLFARELPDYEPLDPVVPQESPEPAVEFLFPPADEGEKADARRRREAAAVARRLRELIADPTPRIRDEATKRLRPVRQGDVCILFRRWDTAVPFEQALLKEGLDYYVAGGKAFFAQQEIHDLAHLCRWLDDPEDELGLAGVLRSPFFGLNDDTLLRLAWPGDGDETRRLWAGLCDERFADPQADRVRFAQRVLTELRGKKDRLPLADLLSLAVERTGYDAALLCEHLGTRKLANLRKLIRLARAFDAAGPFTLSEFAAALRDAVQGGADEQLAATHPEVSDVVRLMTVHQSKGLEFPVVVLADMDTDRGAGGGTVAYHPELGPVFSLPDGDGNRPPHPGLELHKLVENWEEEAELVRQLYVALTRARDHLILSASVQADGRPRSDWLKLIARHLDLETGLPPLDAYFGAASGAVAPIELPTVTVVRFGPEPKPAGGVTRTDRGPLRRFRELIAEASPGPLPPLIGDRPPDRARRTEFGVTELCEADRAVCGTVPPSGGLVPERALPPDGRLPFDEDRTEGRSEYAKIVGSIAHAVLERIDFREPGDVARTIDRCQLLLRGEAAPRLGTRIAAKIEGLLASPLRAELASAERLHREVEFRLRWDRPGIGPPAEIVGTLDALFRDAAGRWHLLDYKTVNDAGDSDVAAGYGLQVAAYALAVARMFGVGPATARLVRLGPPAETIPVPVAAADLAVAADRIDAAIRSLRRV